MLVAFTMGLSQWLLKPGKVMENSIMDRLSGHHVNLLINIIITKSRTAGYIRLLMWCNSNSYEVSLPEKKSNLNQIKSLDPTTSSQGTQGQRTTYVTRWGYHQPNLNCGAFCWTNDPLSSTNMLPKKKKSPNRWKENSLRIKETSETQQLNARCELCLDPEADKPNYRMTFLRHLGKTEYRLGVRW